MLMISRRTDETDDAFMARAFRWNRLCGKAFEDRQARHALCNCNQGRLACGCEENNETVQGPARPFIQARPMTRDELRKFGMLPTAPRPLLGVSRVRAIWYGSGLVFAVSLIAMAVFGMGH